MKKKPKITLIVLLIALIICLIPIPVRIKDGGSVEFTAVLYTYVQWHTDTDVDFIREHPEYRKYYKDGYLVRGKLYFFPNNHSEFSILDD